MIQSRLTPVSGYKQIFATVTAALPGNLQPLSPQESQLYPGVAGQAFQFFCDLSVDIEPGDRLRDVNTGAQYRVVSGGVTRRAEGCIEYLKVICQRL